MIIYGTYRGKQVPVGKLKNGIFKKSVQTRQRLWKHNSYGLDLDYFKVLESAGCREVELRETETGIIYRASMELIITMGIQDKIGDFGPKVYLPLPHWTKKEKAGKTGRNKKSQVDFNTGKPECK